MQLGINDLLAFAVEEGATLEETSRVTIRIAVRLYNEREDVQ